VDGQEWPCAAARKSLTDAFGDREDLARHMAVFLVMAAEDLRAAGPSGLYRRLIGWTLGRDEVCRACGKGGHTAIAGIPPRLVPCDELPTLIPSPRIPDR
jgi:hypothetical protein